MARAQSDHPWEGVYAGLNVGGTNTVECDGARLNVSAIDSLTAPSLVDHSCSGGAVIGGVQFGDNIQLKRLILGLAAELDAWGAQDQRRAVTKAADVIPPGTYAFSGRRNPSSFAIVGPRIGYAGDVWLPYLTLGAAITTRSHARTLTFTPAGATKSTASFNEGANFASTGWAAGAGTEIGLNGAWSITAQYLHIKLGKASDSTTTCSGSAAACAGFSGLSLDTTHSGLSANVFQIGVNYWFGYWDI